MSTYAAFIDVKKAYDTVWRQGLWKRLWDEGVRGKMWRVVKSMYSTVQSAVLIGDEKTEWFELYTGQARVCDVTYPVFVVCKWFGERDQSSWKRSAGRKTESAVIVVR
jgi:hypothetical protein